MMIVGVIDQSVKDLVKSNLMEQIQAVRFMKVVLPKWKEIPAYEAKMADLVEKVVHILSALVCTEQNAGDLKQVGKFFYALMMLERFQKSCLM